LNSGVSSTLQQILVRAFNKFNGGSALSYDGTKMAVIRDNYLYLSTDKGKSWKTITPFNIVNCFDINASYDFSVLIAVPRSGKVLTSTDSGENWRVQTDLSNNWTGSCVSGNGNVLGACTSSGYIWISNDKGVSWNQRAESGSWKFIKSSYDGKILISGRTNSQIWRSTDSGVNWGPIVNSPSITDCWGSLFISSDGSKIIAQKRVDWQVTSSILFFIYKSVDFGVTWNTFTIFNGYYNRQEVTDRSYLAGSTDGQILITGSRSDVIYISNNGGVNWVPYNFTVYSDKWETFSMSGDGNNVIITSNDTTDSNSLTLFISKDSIEVPVNNSVNKDNIIMDIINLYEKQ
jgi:photosystem II stability/assembly factor-like uncharacterized protein